ncbi:terminase family protein [Candidatus Dojkabacteria bacterium]|jgi:hypothetical protein|nr:terminase family protein [Candidatus Dojkabacteria bacterium]
MSDIAAEEIRKTDLKFKQTLSKKDIFDPRILDNDSSSQSLWSSHSVELANQGIKDGYKLKEYPYLKTVQGASLRKANLPFKYTEDELEVLSIIQEDKIWFANNFAKLKDADKGWQNITLRNYQENLLNRYSIHKWNIIMFPRQSGKTTTTIIEIVHFCLTNIDKDCVVIAQSDKVVNEILSKIKECFAGLPFFIQPGFVSFNKKGFVLDNGCRLSIGIASESVVQGFALDFLYIDEYAYIKPSMVDKFWNNIYPSLVNNPNSKCIITSTPNGRNKFYQLWIGAENGWNKFIPYRIYWYEVPRIQSLEEFKADTIANVGIIGWEMGFECSFDTQLKSIFQTRIQKYLRELQLKNAKNWSISNHPIGTKYNIEFVSQDVVQYDLKNDYFLMGIDIGEGLEQDNSTLKIKKIDWCIEEKRLKFISVGVLKTNTMAVEDFAELTAEIFSEFNPSKIKVSVEINTYGGEYFNQIDNLKMYNKDFQYIDNSIFAKFYRNSKTDFERGIRWSSNKKLGVKSFSNLISQEIVIETHPSSIEEYLNFGRMKNDTYGAQYGNDDLVMADVSIAHFIKSNNLFSNEFLNFVKEELRIKYNDEDIETKKRKAEEERKKNSVYTHNGFNLRNHEEHINKEDDDIYLLGGIYM